VAIKEYENKKYNSALKGRQLNIKKRIMADTYSQISIHAVFAVKGRQNFITANLRDRLHQYIAGTINGIDKKAKSLAVGGWKDHVHIFFALPVSMSISDFVGKVKSNSSGWINKEKLMNGHFEWQAGFGAFSYSKSQRDTVIKYIMNQEEHHKEKTFKEEYLKMLHDFDVEFEEKYLFEFYD
jgi:REP element-mobilizing transposase RayT